MCARAPARRSSSASARFPGSFPGVPSRSAPGRWRGFPLGRAAAARGGRPGARHVEFIGLDTRGAARTALRLRWVHRGGEGARSRGDPGDRAEREPAAAGPRVSAPHGGSRVDRSAERELARAILVAAEPSENYFQPAAYRMLATLIRRSPRHHGGCGADRGAPQRRHPLDRWPAPSCRRAGCGSAGWAMGPGRGRARGVSGPVGRWWGRARRRGHRGARPTDGPGPAGRPRSSWRRATR